MRWMIRLPHIASLVLSVLPVAMPTAARAADPAFCRQYAKAALVQARQGLASPRCGAGLQGIRWSSEFSAQYEWCLEASREAIAAEHEARAKVLKGCADR
jgi:hypothetical protein